ncbi:hypothetical protein OPKNFCMD_1695 [Methylobacterium crusticola]|uniref:PNPLA domain-containing protein n=1 Tax=Methylobacterium crusticola TaxID=1697972 RepID=A0ABQ4QVK3_9HYPH|nr:hypothetical protein [Methylobacterium crusticola]GJD48969.1 hypothetical protein OPKNFCMD_1695 [Methylobacterium crusticola]
MKTARDPFPGMPPFWSSVLFASRILWASRISVVSVVAGLVLFGKVVQAQNLLADTSWNTSLPLAVWYWTVFFAALFLIWSFPVHYGARRTLDGSSWLINAHLRGPMLPDEAERLSEDLRHRHATLIRLVPRILGAMPFAAVAIGLAGAWSALQNADALPESGTARTLILALALADAAAAILYGVAVVQRRRWTAALARRVEAVAVYRSRSISGTRLLDGVAHAFVALTFALFAIAYVAPVWISSWIPRAALVPFLLGSLVLPLSALARASHRRGVPYVLLLVLACTGLTASNRHFHDLRTLPEGPTPVAQRQIDFDAALSRWKAANGCAREGEACPPALIVAAEGGASRAAFATATVVGEILDRMPELADHAGSDQPGRRIFAMSGVSGGALGVTLIRAALADAAAGGPPCRFAHRTFFRARLIWDGQASFTWRDCLQALASGDFLSPAFVGLAYRDNVALPVPFEVGPFPLRDRAALLEQAWERHYDYVTRSGESPFSVGDICGREAGRGLCRRFGYLGGPEAGGQDPAGRDAAGRDAAAHDPGRGEPGAAAGAPWLPLLLLNGTSVQTGRRLLTTDLVSTRVSPDGRARVGFYTPAYDLFEAMSTPCAEPDREGQDCPAAARGPLDEAALRDAPDLRLSTAALTSARFPVISPAGTFGVRGDWAQGDRVVDGGYFENSGMTTALDVAKALHEKGVVPLILWVLNEPKLARREGPVPPRPVVTPFVGAAQAAAFLDRAGALLTAPIEALWNTRQGHGAESADLVVRALAAMEEGRPPGAATAQMYEIGVFAEPSMRRPDDATPAETRRCAMVWGQSLQVPVVSMSWWLAPSVQAYLDAQLCEHENRRILGDLMRTLGKR